MGEFLDFPAATAARLEPHLPLSSTSDAILRKPGGAFPLPFVTLTFATSLDSALSLGPGIRTRLSGPQSKAMTHFLRSQHDAICIGVGTAIADDPGLNCRIEIADGHEACHPRPIIIDPLLRWDFKPETKVLQLARSGEGLAPYIITSITAPPLNKQQLLEEHGGKFISLSTSSRANEPASNSGSSEEDPSLPQQFDWQAILAAIRAEGLQSVMIEGGGAVINSLLSTKNCGLLDSVIVTLAPTWLGKGSVTVSPPRQTDAANSPIPSARLTGVTWIPLGEDVVVCGKIDQTSASDSRSK